MTATIKFKRLNPGHYIANHYELGLITVMQHGRGKKQYWTATIKGKHIGVFEEIPTARRCKDVVRKIVALIENEGFDADWQARVKY